MKKIITLLLALVMVLSLCACGKSENVKAVEDAIESIGEVSLDSEEAITSAENLFNQLTEEEQEKVENRVLLTQAREAYEQAVIDAIPTKEELMAQAKEVDSNDINSESFDNFVKAKNDYCNQILLLEGIVKQFGDNYIELAGFYGATYLIDVYLPTEEMLDLKSGQSIVVVGETTDEIKEVSENIAAYTFDTKHFQMPTAYLVKDTVEVTGILQGVNKSYAPAYNIQIGQSNMLKLIYFADSVDTSTLKYDQEIKFSAKPVYENDNWHYYDAEIIE